MRKITKATVAHANRVLELYKEQEKLKEKAPYRYNNPGHRIPRYEGYCPRDSSGHPTR